MTSRFMFRLRLMDSMEKEIFEPLLEMAQSLLLRMITEGGNRARNGDVKASLEFGRKLIQERRDDILALNPEALLLEAALASIEEMRDGTGEGLDREAGILLSFVEESL